MFLQSLTLRNFRNYKEQTVQFNPQFNFIFGKNGQGKTNLLEAIYTISNLKSFRSSSLRDLIGREANSALIESRLILDSVSHDIRIILEPTKKEVWLNKKKPRLFQEYYGLVPLVLFEPRDVYLFRESPSIRRRFINRALFLDNPGTLKMIREYEEVVAQKSRFLKDWRNQGGTQELEAWNERLATLGALLIRHRLLWIQKMNYYLISEYQKITQSPEKMNLVYRCHFLPHLLLTEIPSIENLYKTLIQKIEEVSAEEKRRKESLVGPHRDDWIAFLDDRSIGVMGSQGENRSGVIALKSAQTKMYEKEHKKEPIFLLDDVTSELDQVRSGSLIRYLLETRGQVFMTTTEPAKIPNNYKEKGASFLVEEGQITMLV